MYRCSGPLPGRWPILGAVGSLQLDVLVSRLKQEYGVPVRLEQAPYATARWIVSDNPGRLEGFCEVSRSSVAEDKDLAQVFLARNAWTLNRAIEDWPDIQFLKVRERH